MKRFLAVLLGTALSASVACEAGDAAFPTGEIGCFSDSAEGTEMAQAAARFLVDRRQAGSYSKSFVVTEREDKDSNRYLILILSPDGEKAFGTVRQDFDDALLALLQKMKKHFGDEKVSVILQRPDNDKTNVLEAYFDAKSSGALRGLSAHLPIPTRSPSPSVPSPAPAGTASPKI